MTAHEAYTVARARCAPDSADACHRAAWRLADEVDRLRALWERERADRRTLELVVEGKARD